MYQFSPETGEKKTELVHYNLNKHIISELGPDWPFINNLLKSIQSAAKLKTPPHGWFTSFENAHLLLSANQSPEI